MNERHDIQDVAFMPDGALPALRVRWDEIQARFVDEPRAAVEEADELIQETVERVTQTFARERQNLEKAWSSGKEASTEDLRMALQRYRSFFNRLLST